jgi:uncharacterized protein
VPRPQTAERRPVRTPAPDRGEALAAPRGSAQEARLEWVVLKVSQLCNLNCDYCYVYNRGDTSWSTRPAYISDRVVEGLAGRIKEHCETFGLPQFVLELHGGEPLLLGKRRMERLVETVRSICAPVDVRVILQTNGLKLDSGWLELFARNRMTFGLSLDGPPELADRHRVLRNGRGTTRKLLQIVETLRSEGSAFDDLLGGVLCVVDPSANGAAMVRWFLDQGFHTFDFLLPDGTYRNTPPGWMDAVDYRRFLLEAFEEWYHGGADAPRIRLFETMMMGLLGAANGLDALGGDLKGLCVVESDGSIGISDVVRICLGSFATDSLNVFDNALAEHAAHYRLDALQLPSETCVACPYFSGCGGGYLPHRFDGQSFQNPSIYCPALFALADRMFEVLQEDLPASAWREVDAA